MTNGELCDLEQKISEQAVALIGDCDGDKSKINEGLWNELVRLYRLVEDYLPR